MVGTQEERSTSGHFLHSLPGSLDMYCMPPEPAWTIRILGNNNKKASLSYVILWSLSYSPVHPNWPTLVRLPLGLITESLPPPPPPPITFNVNTAWKWTFVDLLKYSSSANSSISWWPKPSNRFILSLFLLVNTLPAQGLYYTHTGRWAGCDL